MKPFRSRAIAVSLSLLVAAACRDEPDIVELSPNAEPPVSVPTTEQAAAEPPPPATPTSTPSTTEPAPATVPVLADEDAIRISSDFVEALRTATESGDFTAAADMWTGYPFRESDRAGYLDDLIAIHPWLLEGGLQYTALKSWSFRPEWAMTIVAITKPDRSAAATLLLDGTGRLQRIDDRVFQPPRAVTVDATSVVFNGLPLEGSANAYLDGALLDEPTVDHLAMTTAFALPPSKGRPEVLIASFATPELPFVTATIIDRG